MMTTVNTINFVKFPFQNCWAASDPVLKGDKMKKRTLPMAGIGSAQN